VLTLSPDTEKGNPIQLPPATLSPDDARSKTTLTRSDAQHRDAGAPVITRPLYHGADTTVQDIEPLAGMRAAREIELGARHTARGYIRTARETGHDWHDIGAALGLTPDADADQAGQTVGEAAYTYAAGRPDTETATRYGRSFAWTCPSCDRVISDHGLYNGPAEDERGHTDRCLRLAATVARSEAEWEAGQ